MSFEHLFDVVVSMFWCNHVDEKHVVYICLLIFHLFFSRCKYTISFDFLFSFAFYFNKMKGIGIIATKQWYHYILAAGKYNLR